MANGEEEIVIKVGLYDLVTSTTLESNKSHQRLKQYEQACKLKQQGLPQPMFAHQVGVSKRTLTRWGKARTFPERQRRHGDRGLCPMPPLCPTALGRGCAASCALAW